MKTTTTTTQAEAEAISRDEFELFKKRISIAKYPDEIYSEMGLTDEQLGHNITEKDAQRAKLDPKDASQIVGKTPRSLINDAFSALKRGGELTAVAAGKFALAVVGAASFVVGNQIFSLGKIAKFATFGLANTIPGISYKAHKNDRNNLILPSGLLHKETRGEMPWDMPFGEKMMPGSVTANEITLPSRGLNTRKVTIEASITHDGGRVNLLERIGFQLARTGVAAMKQTGKTWIPPRGNLSDHGQQR